MTASFTRVSAVVLAMSSARRMVVTLTAQWSARSWALQRMRARAARIWALVNGGGGGIFFLARPLVNGIFHSIWYY